jgi:membrane protease subunit HflK
MAWNEPGGNQKDPWGGGSGNQGPPDLDEVVRKLQDKLGGIFGGRRPQRGGGDSSGGGPVGGAGSGGIGGKGIGIIAGLAFVAWLLSGIYIIEPAERGVVLRFGAYQEITQPGPHWHIPFPVEAVEKVNVDEVSRFRHAASMLTRDENIVDIELEVQSRIQDPADYLFQDNQPQKTMRDDTETAVREVIGQSDLDFILTEGRGAIATRVQELTQALLDSYKTGLKVTNVNMLPAKPPEQVKSSFDDAIKAREDKERIENQAQAYANEVIPVARGAAAREVENARAYKARVVAESTGESDRFLALLSEYQKAPVVTRQRLYLEAVEEIYGNNSKVLLDIEGGNNLTYLPLDRILQQGDMKPAQTAAEQRTAQDLAPPPVTANPPMRDNDRSRRVR